ncbi:MAG TPA: hypothetical protein VFQ43_00340 [Nitrososphaera sp.]|nr:hypothetical protein [Nitrososphaera sp.]
MTYNKPEVTVLGEAGYLIQGGKQDSSEPAGDAFQVPDCELDD